MCVCVPACVCVRAGAFVGVTLQQRRTNGGDGGARAASLCSLFSVQVAAAEERLTFTEMSTPLVKELRGRWKGRGSHSLAADAANPPPVLLGCEAGGVQGEQRPCPPSPPVASRLLERFPSCARPPLPLRLFAYRLVCLPVRLFVLRVYSPLDSLFLPRSARLPPPPP